VVKSRLTTPARYKRIRAFFMSQRVVYAVLADAEIPAIKFGRTRHMRQRLSGIGSCYPYDLELLGTVEGGRCLEQLIHGCLNKYRLHGEWYRYEGWAKTVGDLIARSKLELLYKYLDKISALQHC
jgi:hypothetical protein